LLLDSHKVSGEQLNQFIAWQAEFQTRDVKAQIAGNSGARAKIRSTGAAALALAMRAHELVEVL